MFVGGVCPGHTDTAAFQCSSYDPTFNWMKIKDEMDLESKIFSDRRDPQGNVGKVIEHENPDSTRFLFVSRVLDPSRWSGFGPGGAAE